MEGRGCERWADWLKPKDHFVSWINHTVHSKIAYYLRMYNFLFVLKYAPTWTHFCKWCITLSNTTVKNRLCVLALYFVAFTLSPFHRFCSMSFSSYHLVSCSCTILWYNQIHILAKPFSFNPIFLPIFPWVMKGDMYIIFKTRVLFRTSFIIANVLVLEMSSLPCKICARNNIHTVE